MAEQLNDNERKAAWVVICWAHGLLAEGQAIPPRVVRALWTIGQAEVHHTYDEVQAATDMSPEGMLSLLGDNVELEPDGVARWLRNELHQLYLGADSLTPQMLDYKMRDICGRWEEKNTTPEQRAAREISLAKWREDPANERIPF